MKLFELKYVSVEIADLVATVTMDNPPVNAQTDETQEELIFALDCLSDRDDVRVIVLTGEGRCSVRASTSERVGKTWAGGRPQPTFRARELSFHQGVHQAGDRHDQRSRARGWARHRCAFRNYPRVRERVGGPSGGDGWPDGGCRHAMQLFGRSNSAA